MLAKLFYPVVNPLFNFEFCKGYYPRVANKKMNGRVARLLVFPLLTALEKTIGKSDYLEFMKFIKYFCFIKQNLALFYQSIELSLNIQE